MISHSEIWEIHHALKCLDFFKCSEDFKYHQNRKNAEKLIFCNYLFMCFLCAFLCLFLMFRATSVRLLVLYLRQIGCITVARESLYR